MARQQEAEADAAEAELDRRKSTLEDLAREERDKLSERMSRWADNGFVPLCP